MTPAHEPERPGSPDAAEAYEVVFAATGRPGEDVVRMTRTSAEGPGGNPIYVDATGIVRAEISSQGEVRLLATSGGQIPARVLRARAVT